MPISIPDGLSGGDLLAKEDILVMTEQGAMDPNSHPLRVILLNLTPDGGTTEIHLMEKLSNTPLQLEVTLLPMTSHEADHEFVRQLEAFYRTFVDIADECFDGMVITGRAVERRDLEDVGHWDELCDILDWSQSHVRSTLHIDWAAQAGIFHHYGICSLDRPQRVKGIFAHRCSRPESPLLHGFDSEFLAPRSCVSEVRAEDIEAHRELELLVASDEAGAYIAKSVNSRNFFVFGLPEDHFPGEPSEEWCAHGQRLFANWLDGYVCQQASDDRRRAGQGDDGVRAQNEDDDGYDPWSDRRESTPLFERDPWD